MGFARYDQAAILIQCNFWLNFLVWVITFLTFFYSTTIMVSYLYALDAMPLAF